MRKAVAILSVILALAIPVPTSTANQDDKPTLQKCYSPYINLVEPNAPGYTLPLDLNDIGNFSAVDSQLNLKNAASSIYS